MLFHRCCLPALILCVEAAYGQMSANDADSSGTPDWKKLNDIFGLPLWADGNLFDDREEDVASRLKWPSESSTSYGNSYRLYAGESVRVLGARPYSLALYAADGRVEQLSMVFANKGDYTGLHQIDNVNVAKDVAPEERERLEEENREKVIKGFSAAVRADGDTISQNLTAVLGPPDSTFFGVGSGMREKVMRWDWQGHAFLLATPRQEYALLRIMSVDMADKDGRTEKLTADELKDVLAQRVQRRPNGDVVIQDIPMVDQGPKGYCVPATWERYLRYLGIPADMYILAMKGGTLMGGEGTDPEQLEASVAGLISAYGRQIDNEFNDDARINAKNLGKYIDKGVPMMWCCLISPRYDQSLLERTQQRQKVTDWDAYKTDLDEKGVRMQHIEFPSDAMGHMRMIIGYNPITHEIAISDSWGPDYAERWMTMEEAEQISEQILIAVKW